MDPYVFCLNSIKIACPIVKERVCCFARYIKNHAQQLSIEQKIQCIGSVFLLFSAILFALECAYFSCFLEIGILIWCFSFFCLKDIKALENLVTLGRKMHREFLQMTKSMVEVERKFLRIRFPDA